MYNDSNKELCVSEATLDLSDKSDVDLIRLIAEGREEALSELYDRYNRLVYSLAIYILEDPQTAEEVTQDVFVRIWENAGSYRMERAQVSTWLTSIARHRAIDVLRRQGVRPEGHSVTWDDLIPAEVPKLDGGNPEDAADQSLLRDRVQQAIRALPAEQQAALKLAYFYGYSHSQIAAQLGEPLGTIKTRIRMAMQKLRGILVTNE